MKKIFSESLISPRWVDSSTVNYRFPIASTGNETIPTRTRQDGYRSKPIRLESNSIELIGTYRNAANRSGCLIIYLWLSPTSIEAKSHSESTVQLETVGNMYFGEFQAGAAIANGTSFKSNYTFDENVEFIQIYTTMDLTAITVSESTPEGAVVSLLSPTAVTDDFTIEDDFELAEVTIPVLIEDPFSLGPDPDPFLTIAPVPGTYSEPVLVQISVTKPATIYYTTDGTAPTTASLVYTAPFYVFSNITITALGVPTDRTASEVTSAAYTVIYTPAISPASGVYADAVTVTMAATPSTLRAQARQLRTASLLQATNQTIHYTTDTRPPTTDSSVYTGSITVTDNTVVQAITAIDGVTSAAASANYVVVSTPAISPVSGSYANPLEVTLTCDNVLADIHYTLDGSTPTEASPIVTNPLSLIASATIQCLAAIDGVTSSIVSATYNLPPVITPASGIYEFTQPITITAESGATIYYTTDGSTPTAESNVYTSSINLDHSAHIKAISVHNSVTSAIAQQQYEIVYPTPAETLSSLYYDATTHQYAWKNKSIAKPTFSLAEGAYNAAQTVSISAASATTIYYTLDGSVPTEASTKYTTPITLSAPTTVSAIAVNGSAKSIIATAVYVINLSPHISSMHPSDIQEGIAYASVIVSGSNLSKLSNVTLNGVHCPVISAANDFSNITISIPGNTVWAANNNTLPASIHVVNGTNSSETVVGQIIPKWLQGMARMIGVDYSLIGDPAFGIHANGTGKSSKISISPTGGIYTKTPYKWWYVQAISLGGWDPNMSNIWYCGTDDLDSEFINPAIRLTDNATNSNTNIKSMCFDSNSNFYWSLPDGLYKGTPSSASAFTWVKIIDNIVFDSICAASTMLYGVQLNADYSYNSIYSINPSLKIISKLVTLPVTNCIGYKLGCNPETGYLYAIPSNCSAPLPILLSKDNGNTWIDSGSGSVGSFILLKEGPTFGDNSIFFTASTFAGTYKADIAVDGSLSNITKISSSVPGQGIAYKFNRKPTLYMTTEDEASSNIHTLIRQF